MKKLNSRNYFVLILYLCIMIILLTSLPGTTFATSSIYKDSWKTDTGLIVYCNIMSGKYGIKKADGTIIEEAKYDSLEYDENLEIFEAAIYFKEENGTATIGIDTLFFDKTGKYLSSFGYSSKLYFNYFYGILNDEIILSVTQEDKNATYIGQGKTGLYNIYGEEILPCEYDRVYGRTYNPETLILDGIFPVEKEFGDNITYVNLQQKEVLSLPEEAFCAMPFSEGYSAIKYGDSYSQYFEVNEDTTLLITPINFIDLKGNVISTNYDYVQLLRELGGHYEDLPYFADGKAIVKDFIPSLVQENDYYSYYGKIGIINKNFEEIVPCIYTSIDPFSEGLAFAYNNDWHGYIDKEGTQVITLKANDSTSIHGSRFKNGIAEIQEYRNGKNYKYYNITMPLEYIGTKGNTNSTSFNAPIIASVTSGSTDLFSTKKVVSKNSTEQITLKSTIEEDTKTEATELYLIQDTDTKVKFSGDTLTVKPGQVFQANQPIYLMALDTETGKSTARQTTLWVSSDAATEAYQSKILNVDKIDGEMVVNSVACNNSEKDVTAFVYTAVYDKKGNFKGGDVRQTLLEGNTDTAVDIALSCDIKSGDIIKTFFWENMIPLTDVDTITVK